MSYEPVKHEQFARLRLMLVHTIEYLHDMEARMYGYAPNEAVKRWWKQDSKKFVRLHDLMNFLEPEHPDTAAYFEGRQAWFDDLQQKQAHRQIADLEALIEHLKRET